MKTGRSSAAVIGVAGGIALGMWIASAITLMDRDTIKPAPAVTRQVTEPVAAPVVEPSAIKTRRVAARAAATPVAPAVEVEAPKLVMTVPVTAPQLHNRMKPVLARGTKINLAVEGFSDAEQFATLAHAARNTQVPFILLKHRVLTEHRSLADAIRASKPDLDAEAEVQRARSAAKSDLAALSATANN
ncbi:MAG: hypothetical protein Q7R30_04205 [Acidobacteriota bacterium]|nr:hypothetical protein [Acidobacteriota bacterium]